MPIFFPQDSVLNTSEFDRPKTPLAEAFGDTITEAISTGPTADIFLRSRQVFFPGNKLNAEEYKKSEYFRPGIEYPNGVGENIARIRANKYDKERERQFELSQTNNGIVQTASNWTASLIGSLLDPLTDATAVAAPELAGVRVASVLSKLNNISRFVPEVGRGLAEGALVATPQALSEYDVQNQLGMDPKAAEILSTIGLGAGFGGAIRGFIAWRNPIKPEADLMARQTAVNQLAEGKSVNVNDIVQQGFYEQSKADNRSSLISELNNQHGGNVETFLNDINKTLESKANELKNVTSREKATRFISGLSSEPSKSVDSVADLNKALDALNTPAFERNANQRFLLNNLPSSEEFNKALDIVYKPGFERTASENVFIKSFLSGNEKELIEQRLTKHQEDINSIDTELQKLNPELKRNAKKIKLLNDQKEALQSRIKVANARISELKGEKLNLTRAELLQKDIEELSRTKNALLHLRNEFAVNEAMTSQDVKPTDFNELKLNSDLVNGWQGNSSINAEQVKNFEDELKGIEDDKNKQIEELREDIKGIKLNSEDKEALEQIKIDKNNFKKISNALLNLANCLKG